MSSTRSFSEPGPSEAPVKDQQPARDPLRVYCAGPLFNQAERSEMTAIAEVLGEAGFNVYLPHRDGMEFRLVLDVLVDRGWPAATAAHFLHASIFALDVFQLAVECGPLVWNLNGRTPDEGAVSEAAIAWTLGKPVVAYQDDVRSLIAGRMNPLLLGLVEFEKVETIAEIPDVLTRVITEQEAISPPPMPPRLRRAVEDGERLWEALGRSGADCDNARIADVVADLFAPREAVGGRPA